MLNFCTLFDSNFLIYGITMYESLKRSGCAFHLHVVAFNSQAYEHLKQLDLDDLTAISLQEFESSELLAIKPSRSVAEYCWTCTPSVIKYCIDRYKLDHCIYVDADLLFFSDPVVLYDELKSNNKSVFITKHNYADKYNHSVTSGKYCVQFMIFRNDKNGIEALEWWRKACIDWCYARYEDGKFGDQKYLDDWEERFEGVHVCRNEGAGFAPWNTVTYNLFQKGDSLFLKRKDDGLEFKLIFFHFHGFRLYANKAILTRGYELSRPTIYYIYNPYLLKLNKLIAELARKGIEINLPANSSPVRAWPITTALFLKDVARSAYNGVRLLIGKGSAKHFRFYHKEYHIYTLKNGEIA
jgi:hypothetical protein